MVLVVPVLRLRVADICFHCAHVKMNQIAQITRKSREPVDRHENLVADLEHDVEQQRTCNGGI
jgi:hypothetical protein